MKYKIIFTILTGILSVFLLSCEISENYKLSLTANLSEDRSTLECIGKITKGKATYYQDKGFIIGNTKELVYNPKTCYIIGLSSYEVVFKGVASIDDIKNYVPLQADSTYYVRAYIRSNYGLFYSDIQPIFLQQVNFEEIFEEIF